ncbi:hypothetical protein LSTR_LSTR017025 [Laodelphax striatellus]|uniref:Uncharacterized protein n=1 Tax=Laodelphax striatellus TaxID=195883 RepID=A0A482XHN0_LAOST|nr:hypothetical protein LSTR_LSTR017025 [Laodelphax striatellus]
MRGEEEKRNKQTEEEKGRGRIGTGRDKQQEKELQVLLKYVDEDLGDFLVAVADDGQDSFQGLLELGGAFIKDGQQRFGDLGNFLKNHHELFKNDAQYSLAVIGKKDKW